MNTAAIDQPEAPSSPEPTVALLAERRQRDAVANAKPQPIAKFPPKPAGPGKHRRKRIILAGLAILAIGAASAYYLEFCAPFESTDDAFIEAHVASIAPQVSGRVARLLVADNQQVSAGDVLVEIDPRDYQAKLEQELASLAAAKDRLGQAKAQFTVDRAKVEEERSNVVAAVADEGQADSDDRRYRAAGKLAVSVTQMDLAATHARSAGAHAAAARSKEAAAEAQTALDQAGVQTAAAGVQRSEADVRQAELDLSYTQVRAPETGYVTHRTVEAGNYVQTGQDLLAIVPRQVWVVANFKETQLSRMRAGQPVTVKMDAYPQIAFKGRVDSIQSGAGPRFSLLPPENASGNYVKVVQRVPVKIVLDPVSDAQIVLGPGMSVVPTVRIK